MDVTYEILSLGDASYLYAVINAVSRFNGYGILGALGAMLGLLILGVKGVTANGGPKLELQWILISIIVFWVMFVPRVDEVMIVELNTPPGYCNPNPDAPFWQQGCAPRTYVVDNVPLGLAATGYFVSNVGVAIAELFETTFSSADDTERVSTGAIGQHLRILTQLRRLQEISFSDPDGDLEYVRRNVASYMAECTLTGVRMGHMKQADVLNPDVDNSMSGIPALDGIRWAKEGHPVTLLKEADVGFDSQTFNCATGWDHIVSTLPEDLQGSFMEALSPDDVVGNGSEPISSAFADLASPIAEDAQAFMMANIVAAVAGRAVATGPMTSDDVKGLIMVEEAAAKRAAQAAGEENIFIRLLRPTVSFFETLFYALAPLMAFLVATGQFGIKLVSRYLQMTIWVILWFPLLAVINLYTNIQMKSFMDALGREALTPLDAWSVSTAAIDYLGTASTMAAAVPYLSMSLIFGGVYAMSGLANRLQGSDMIDEGKISPDATKVGAAYSQAPAISDDWASTPVVTGAPLPSLDKSVSSQGTLQASEQAMHQTTSTFSQNLTNAVNEVASYGKDGSTLISGGIDQKYSDTVEEALKLAVSNGTITSEEFQVANQMSQSDRLALVAKAGVDSPIGGGWTQGSEESAATESERRAASAKRDIAAKLSKDESVKSMFAEAISYAVQNNVSEHGSLGLSATDSTALVNSASDVASASETYSRAWSAVNSSGMSESVDMGVAHVRFEESGADLSELIRGINDSGLNEQYKSNLARIEDMPGLLSAESQKFEAAVVTLQSGEVSSDRLDERAEALEYLTSHVFKAGAAQNVDSEISEAGSALGIAEARATEAGARAIEAEGVAGTNVTSGQVSSLAGQSIANAEMATEEARADSTASKPKPGQDELPSEDQAALLDRGKNVVEDVNDAGKSDVLHQGAALIGNPSRWVHGYHPAEEGEYDPGGSVNAANKALADEDNSQE